MPRGNLPIGSRGLSQLCSSLQGECQAAMCSQGAQHHLLACWACTHTLEVWMEWPLMGTEVLTGPLHTPAGYYVQAKTTPKASCVQTSGSSALHQWQVMLCFAAVCGVPCCQVPSQSWQLLAYLSIIARSNVRSLM